MPTSQKKKQYPPLRRGPRWRAWAAAAVLLLAGVTWLVLHWRSSDGRQSGPSQTTFALEPEAKVFAAYAGSSSCRACHLSEYEHWSQSHHGLAERVIDPELDRPAFGPPRSFSHGSQTTAVRAAGDTFEISAK